MQEDILSITSYGNKKGLRKTPGPFFIREKYLLAGKC